MSGVLLDIDAIYNGAIPDAVIRLSCPDYTSTIFTSPVVGDLVIGGSATTVSPFDDYAAEQQQNLRNGIAAASMASFAVKNFLGLSSDLQKGFSGLSNYMNKQRWQTLQLYQGSTGGDLAVQMVFIVTSADNIHRYRQAIELSSCIFPDPENDLGVNLTRQEQATAAGQNLTYSADTIMTDSKSLFQQMRAPCGYRIDPNTGMPRGIWTIQIGSYFRATGFILKNAKMTQTKERLGQHEAIISTVDCQFVPALAVTSSQFLSWFSNY